MLQRIYNSISLFQKQYTYLSYLLMTTFSSSKLIIILARDFMLEKQIARHFVFHNHTLLPFYATQIINPFLNSSISANHDNFSQL